MAVNFRYAPDYAEQDEVSADASVESTVKPRIHRAERLVDVLDEVQDEVRDKVRDDGRGRAPEQRGSKVQTERAGKYPRPDSIRDAVSRGEEPRRLLESEYGDAVPSERTADRHAVAVSVPTILSVTPEGEGETLAIVLALPTSEADAEKENYRSPVQKPKRVKLHLLVEQYADLREEGLTVRPGEITPSQADALMVAGELCAAIRRGMGLLQYGDRSARRLASKLAAKGIDREIAATAAAYLVRKGYICEDDTARRRAEQDLLKGWGPRRIREDLRAQGFASDTVEEAMETLADVDFGQACATVMRKKYGEVPADREDRRKMTASLMRLGYDMDHIREAMRLAGE